MQDKLINLKKKYYMKGTFSRDHYFNLILLIITIGALLYKCGDSNNITIETRKDTTFIPAPNIIVDVPTHVDKPSQIINHYHQHIEQGGSVDTGAIVLDYFNKRLYRDTSRTDSIDIYIQEEVFKNELISRKLAYKWKAPTMVIKETTTLTKPFFSAGLFLGIGKNYTSAGPIGFYSWKKNNLGVGFDLINRSPTLMYSRKLNFSK